MANIEGGLCGGRLASHSDRTRCLEQCHAPSHAFACTEAGSCWVGAVGSAEPPQYTSLDASFTPLFSHRPLRVCAAGAAPRGTRGGIFPTFCG
jgi:hypothetical protein